MNYYFMIIYGLIIGSFMSVCIYRIPKGIKVYEGRSKCPHCGHVLKSLDLIPIVSYLVLKGKCRYCMKKISIRYPLIEILNGILYGAVYKIYGNNIETIVYCSFLSIMIVLAVLDADSLEVPSGGLLLILALGILATCSIHSITYYDRFISLFIMSVPLFLLSFFKEGSIGMGDILYAGAAGVLFGGIGILISIMIAYLFSVVVSLIRVLQKKANGKTPIAMFPYFLIGNISYILYGKEILSVFHLSLF